MRCRPLRRSRHACACACVLALGVAWSGEAFAADDERGRPWARGTGLAGFGLGVGIGEEVTHLHLEAGARYFVVNGFALGLTLSDTILIYSESLKDRNQGIENRLPTNAFRLVPHLQYVFFRNRWFSPYVLAGVGPAFLNHGGGTHGYWRAMPGAYIGLGKSGLFLDIGMQFDGMFPVSRCQDAVTDDQSGKYPAGLCTFGWGPHIGLVGTFGGRGQSRRSKRTAPPPSDPVPREAEPAPPPVEPPAEPPAEPSTIDDAPPSEPPASVPSEPPPTAIGSPARPDPSAPEPPIPPPF